MIKINHSIKNQNRHSTMNDHTTQMIKSSTLKRRRLNTTQP